MTPRAPASAPVEATSAEERPSRCVRISSSIGRFTPARTSTPGRVWATRAADENGVAPGRSVRTTTPAPRSTSSTASPRRSWKRSGESSSANATATNASCGPRITSTALASPGAMAPWPASTTATGSVCGDTEPPQRAEHEAADREADEQRDRVRPPPDQPEHAERDQQRDQLRHDVVEHVLDLHRGLALRVGHRDGDRQPRPDERADAHQAGD